MRTPLALRVAPNTRPPRSCVRAIRLRTEPFSLQTQLAKVGMHRQIMYRCYTEPVLLELQCRIPPRSIFEGCVREGAPPCFHRWSLKVQCCSCTGAKLSVTLRRLVSSVEDSVEESSHNARRAARLARGRSPVLRTSKQSQSWSGPRRGSTLGAPAELQFNLHLGRLIDSSLSRFSMLIN